MRRVAGCMLVFAVTLVSQARADEREDGAVMSASRTAPLFHPDGPGVFRWRASAGALVDVLPRRVAESEMREVPQLTGNFRVGLPYGFSTDLRAGANVIANQIALGVAWSRRIRDFSFSVLDHQGVWYGFLGVEGFDATGWGLLNFPGVSIGVPMKHVRFSLLGEIIVTFAQHTTLGDASKTSRQNVSVAGTSALLTVETLLDAGGIIYFGAGILRTVPGYQAWVAFSDESVKLPYPRFVGGYVF